MEILRAENITKIYQAETIPVTALDHVNVSIQRGSFVAVIGRSGSGKSTLLNVLSGLEEADEGNVFFRQKNLKGLSDIELSKIRRRHMGFVFQSYHLLPELTVMENILLPLQLDNKKPDEEYIKMLLADLNLTHKKKMYPRQLSGGECQRAAIARALSAKPEVLFADEPTGNLDVKSGEEVMAVLAFLQKKIGQTIIMVTHDLSIARQADYILQISDGRIVKEMEGNK